MHGIDKSIGLYDMNNDKSKFELAGNNDQIKLLSYLDWIFSLKWLKHLWIVKNWRSQPFVKKVDGKKLYLLII